MSKINSDAKKRHKKLFEGHYQSRLGHLWFLLIRAIKKVLDLITPSRKILPSFRHPLDGLPAPKRLYMTVTAWSMLILVMTSVNISSANYDEGADYTDENLGLEEGFDVITDEEGYIVKSSPLEGEALFSQNRSDKVEHEVQPGDTLSVIAYRYGLKSSTIKYANPTIGSGDYLKNGQKLSIPPKDGYYVKAKAGDSIAKLIEKYKGNLDKTKEFNGLDGELIADTDLLIVDGQPEVTYIASSPGKSGTSSIRPTVLQYDIPPNPQGWILPTHGLVTQGFHSGHYAYDIADRSQPAIVAAAGGTVVKAHSGDYGGGYGNHIVIDHGNGYVTLYAHAEALYVNVGDTVKQGQVIAKMGKSGRVRGATEYIFTLKFHIRSEASCSALGSNFTGNGTKW